MYLFIMFGFVFYCVVDFEICLEELFVGFEVDEVIGINDYDDRVKRYSGIFDMYC